MSNEFAFPMRPYRIRQERGSRTSRRQRRTLRKLFVESLEVRRLLATTAGGPGGLDAPDGMSSLELWLDGSDIDADGAADTIVDGSTVSGWLDKSGYGRDANGVLGAPSYVASSPEVNGAPVVRFSTSGGADQLYTTHNFDSLGSDYSIFAISRYTGGANQRVVTSKTRNWLFGHWGGGDERWHAEGWIHQTGSATTDFQVYAGIIGPSVNGNASDPGADFFKNGVPLTTNDQGSNSTAYKPGALALGAWTSGGEASNAEVAEVILYNRGLNDAERLIVQNYLSSKYDLAIGSEDLYSGDQPGAGDYDLDVFGVGQVDVANQSFDAGTAGFGIELSTADNGDFVLAGHKVPSNSKTTAGALPAGISQRWDRVWYVDTTDANNNVSAEFTFDYSDAGLTLTNESSFALLKSTDGGANWTAVASPTTVNGDRLTFSVGATDLEDALYTLGDAADLPIVTTTAAPVAAELGGAATVIDPGVGLADTDSATLSGAIVELTAGATAGDTLAPGTLPGGISVDAASTPARLVLTGSASLADYQSALRGVTYSNANTGTSVAPRTVTFSASDPDSNTGSNTRTLLPVATASSDNVVWQGDIGSAWTNPMNWLGDRVPDANDVAVFNDPDSVSNTVDVTGATLVGGLQLANHSETFTFTGTVLTTDHVSQTGSGLNRLTAVLSESGLPGTEFSADIAAGTFELTNPGNVLTGTAAVHGGGELVGVGDAAGSSLDQLQVDLNSGTLTVRPGSALPADLGGVTSGLELWLDAADIDATPGADPISDGQEFGSGSGRIGQWADKSGNNRDAIPAAGTPQVATAQLNGLPTVQFRSGFNDGAVNDEEFNISGPSMFAKEMFFVWRSPSPTFSDYGGILGRTADRSSTFIVERNNVVMHSNQYPLEVDRNGVPLSSPFNMSPIDEFMVMRVEVNNSNTSPTTYRLGDVTGWSMDLDLAEVVAYNRELTATEQQDVRQYLTAKWFGLAADLSRVSISVDGNSTIRLDPGVGDAEFGHLSIAGDATLHADSTSMGKRLSFSSTTLDGAATVDTSGMADVTLHNVTETSASSVDVSGDGFLRLPTANSYSGTTTVGGSASLAAGNAAALGTPAAGTMVLPGGALLLDGSFTTNEPITLAGQGNARTDAALLNRGGDSNVDGLVTLSDAATIRAESNTLRLRGGVDTAGQPLELRTDGRIEIDSQGVSGGGSLLKTGGNWLEIGEGGATGSYTGGTTIDGGHVDVRGDDAFGTGPITIQSTGTNFLTRSGADIPNDLVTTAPVILRHEDATTSQYGGQLTLGASTTFQVSNGGGILEVLGTVAGNQQASKTGPGTLILSQANAIADFDLAGGTVRIANENALGNTTEIEVDSGETLAFDGDFTFDATDTLSVLRVHDGALSSFRGTTVLDIPIEVSLLGDITFGGEGDLIVKQGFGNGAAAVTDNFLNHYGFDRTGDDRESLNLHLNGGMLNGGSPTSYGDFTGESLLTSGPRGSGLNFDTDADFLGTGAIDQSDNYKNLFIGYLNSTETGVWQFRNSDRDDWGTMWVDIDQDGVFESNTGTLASNNGELLAWNNNGTFSVNLTNPLGTGRYLVAFTHLEGGGGSRIEYSFKSPSMPSQAVIHPASPSQAGLWSAFAAVTPDNEVTKTGSGTTTLFGANTFNGSVHVVGGTLVAAHDDALGGDGGDVYLGSGTSLGLRADMLGNPIRVDGDDLFGADGRAAGQTGTIVNLAGDNEFLGSIEASRTPFAQEFSISSNSGTLSLGQSGATTIDVQYSALTLQGDGDLAIYSDIFGNATAGEEATVRGFVFNGNAFRQPGDPNQLQEVLTADSLDLNGDGDFRALFPVLVDRNQFDNYGTTFLANLVIPDRLGGGTPYDVTFRGVRADDANQWWLDRDQDGRFETPDNGSGQDERIVNVGCCPTNFTATVSNLSPGSYGIQLQHREGGGGADLRPQIDLGDGNGFQFLDPGDMLGGVELTTIFVPDLRLTKQGSGTATLLGDNSAHPADYLVVEGTLVAGSDNSLGDSGGATSVRNGATLALTGNITISGESLTLDGTGAPGQPGVLVNRSGDNTLGATSGITAAQVSQGHIAIASLNDPGTGLVDTLTIDAPIDLVLSRLTVDGDGDTVINGAIQGFSGALSPALDTLDNFGTGDYPFTADGQTFTARVDNDGSDSWLLLGRGRESWEFDADGQGSVAGVSLGLGTPAAFAPAAYSEAIINDLLAQSSVPMSDLEIRLRRAADPAGASYQEARWRDVATTTWTWDLDQGSGLDATYEIVSGAGSPFLDTTSNTRDTISTAGSDAGNDAQRVFTWAWGGHANQQGFSYGGSVANGANNATSFLWEAGSENHAIPYTEVYIRSLSTQPIVRDNRLTKSGSGILTLRGANSYQDGTTVAEGELRVDNPSGSATGSGDVSVLAGAELTGDGSIDGAVQLATNSRLEPGIGGPGDLATGPLALDSGSVVEVQLNGTAAGGTYDQLLVGGSASLDADSGGGATLELTVGYTPGPMDSFTLLSSTGGVSGEFANAPPATTLLLDGHPFVIDYGANGGNDVLLSYDTSPVIDADDSGSGVDNVILVRLAGTHVEIVVDSVIVFDSPFANLTTITINGQAGDDLLTVDYSGGNPIPAGGLFYNGNDNVGGARSYGDMLVVDNGAFGVVVHNLTGPDAGSLDLDNDGIPEITYTGLEPVDTTGSTASDFVFNLPATDNDAELLDLGGGQSRLRSTNATFELTDFANPSGSITIRGGDGNDQLVVTSLQASYAGTLTFDGQGDSDSAAIDGAVDLAGSLAITAESILLANDVTSGGTQDYDGPVTLVATVALDGSAIRFAGTVDGAVAGGQALDITGSTELNGAVGAMASLASLTIDGATAMTAGSVTTTGLQTYLGPVTLLGDTILRGSTISFGDTLDGAFHLMLEADTVSGTVSFGAAVGAANAPTSLDLLAFDLALGVPVEVDGPVDIELSDRLEVSPSGALRSGGAAVTLRAGDMDLQGPIDAGGGSLDVSSSNPVRQIALGSGPAVKGSGLDAGTAAFGLQDSELELLLTSGTRRFLGDPLGDQFNVHYTGVDPRSIDVFGLGGDDQFFAAPSIATPLVLDGGSPSAPALPGAVLHLDMSGAAAPVVIDTIGGFAISAGTATVLFVEMETLQLCDASGEIDNADMGDLYLRTTNDRERIIISLWNDGGLRLRIDNLDTRVSQSFDEHFGLDALGNQALQQLLVYAQDGDDLVSVASHVVDSAGVPIPVEFHGEAGDDYLTGGLGGDILVGGPGNDRLLGGEGNNHLFGDGHALDSDGIPLEDPNTDGDDQLSGREGSDRLFGGGGADRLSGGGGDDYLHGGSGDDLLDGGLDDDVVVGAEGDDRLSGSYGNDILLGGVGRDSVYGQAGHDVLLGGDHLDTVRGGSDDDLIVGGNAVGVSATSTDAALRAILAEWVNDRSNVPGGLGVLQLDGVRDLLIGDLGADALHQDGEDRVYDFRLTDGDRNL